MLSKLGDIFANICKGTTYYPLQEDQEQQPHTIRGRKTFGKEGQKKHQVHLAAVGIETLSQDEHMLIAMALVKTTTKNTFVGIVGTQSRWIEVDADPDNDTELFGIQTRSCTKIEEQQTYGRECGGGKNFTLFFIR